ncbi:MAG TPA: endonuclease domain-containing protein [Gallionellaceae bacterium]|nr:endonuclease domain-containing protein [Gallionellaceae bacterium]
MRNPTTQNRARSLRNHATDTERHLWRYLRGCQLGGHRFRRQAPIGNYIADFACLETKLIVELDGGQHQEQTDYDVRRDAQMEAQGFRVLRFWDNQVFQETQAVLEVILQVLEERTSPHPNLPPRYAQGKELNPLPPLAGEGRDGGGKPESSTNPEVTAQPRGEP